MLLVGKKLFVNQCMLLSKSVIGRKMMTSYNAWKKLSSGMSCTPAIDVFEGITFRGKERYSCCTTSSGRDRNYWTIGMLKVYARKAHLWDHTVARSIPRTSWCRIETAKDSTENLSRVNGRQYVFLGLLNCWSNSYHPGETRTSS